MRMTGWVRWAGATLGLETINGSGHSRRRGYPVLALEGVRSGEGRFSGPERRKAMLLTTRDNEGYTTKDVRGCSRVFPHVLVTLVPFRRAPSPTRPSRPAENCPGFAKMRNASHFSPRPSCRPHNLKSNRTGKEACGAARRKPDVLKPWASPRNPAERGQGADPLMPDL